MSKVPPPTLRLRVDTQALAANWRALDAMSGDAATGAAVKADCYGLGTDICVPALRDAGASSFFVAHWSEVPALLGHIRPDQIWVLHGPNNAAEAEYARATGVWPVINSHHQASVWQESGGGPCHLMVETGINRLGVPYDELGEQTVQALDVCVIMSHLASADEDSPLNAVQLQRFNTCLPQVSHKTASLSNSAGIALGADYHFGLTRPGIALYGGAVRPELEGVIAQVAYPEAAIIQRRRLNAGDSVGYNAKFTATRPMDVATVSIGYADGFLRSRGNDAALHHNETVLPMLGRVSMDMVVVDCTAAPHLKEGDFLQIPNDLVKISRNSGLSQYELLTVIGRRFDFNT